MTTYRSEIVCDEDSLTLDEAKAMWNKHYSDAAQHINDGNTVEMALWVDMKSPGNYHKTLAHISTDAESDGVGIWEGRRDHFTKF